MIIDFHTHTFPDTIAERAVAGLRAKSHTRSFSDGTAEGLLRRNEAAGIDLAVILPVATSPQQVRHVNDAAAGLNEYYAAAGERAREDHRSDENSVCSLLSFGCMHPALEEPGRELALLKSHGFKGIKIHPAYQGENIDSLPFLRIMDLCAEQELTVVTHAGWDIGFPGAEYCMPKRIRRAVRTVDPEGRTLKLVAAHMGGWRCWESVPDLLADTPVYLDTSFSTGQFYPLTGAEYDGYYEGKSTAMLGPEGFMALVRAFGAKRILFGTDNPWSDATESLDFLRRLPLNETELHAILGGNAAELLGL